jgi:hypothetical protein
MVNVTPSARLSQALPKRGCPRHRRAAIRSAPGAAGAGRARCGGGARSRCDYLKFPMIAFAIFENSYSVVTTSRCGK